MRDLSNKLGLFMDSVSVGVNQLAASWGFIWVSSPTVIVKSRI